MSAAAMKVASLALITLSTALLACERPPVQPPPDDEPPPPGRVGPIALETFTQDRPAIAGKWFDYEPEGHTLTPKAQAWIVRDREPLDGAVRHFAFRIIDIYEAGAAESGLFTLGIATHDDSAPGGGAWSAEQEWVTPRNIKLTGQMCLDVHTQRELDCDGGADWQLRLAEFSYFSPLAGLAVAEPGVYVKSVAGTDAFGEVHIARLDGVTALTGLPAPTTLSELADAPPPSWDVTDWSFGELAVDLPQAGMAIGSRVVGDGFTATGDVLWLMTARFSLYRLTVSPVVDGDLAAGLRFTFHEIDVDRADFSAPEALPDNETSVDVAMPGTDSATYLTLSNPETLQLASEDLEGVSWPYAPPRTTRYDLVVERIGADDVRLLLSPATAVKNATQLGIDENVPPVSTP